MPGSVVREVRVARETLPSGRQLELRLGDQRAVVVEVGAGLRSYAAAGRELLDGYGPDEMATSGRGQVLMPWPNRIEDGLYEFDGTRHQLPLTEPEARNAIHGLVRWVPWSVARHDRDRARLEYALHPQQGYPFSVAVSVEYSLSADGLRVDSTATNVGREPCPFGCGAHPYLTLGTETVDPIVLSAPGGSVLQVDGRGIPVGVQPVDGTEYDFRRPRPIAATKLDHAFTDLDRDDDGLAHVVLRHPDTDETVTVWLDDSYRYLQLFTGDPLPSVQRRSLAVEPMTCAPNAFRSGDGLIVLEPGDTITAAWGIRREGTA